MSYIKGEDRDQITIMPECLDDYVSAENPARLIDAFVESLCMAVLGFRAEPATEGRPGYDPRDMLKLYIYGYFNKIRSSRRLQTEAGRNLELMWLLRKIVPDFRCIADFRKDNASAIKEVFREFVKLCDKAKLLSHDAVVIDGSKFRAVNSDNNCHVKGNVAKLITQAEERIAKYMAELDANDKTERRPEALTTNEIHEVLEYLNKRKEQLTDALTRIEESGENHLCVTDPECRLMKTRDGYKPSYNVQTAVEADNHIIVHYEVTNECVDWNQLEAAINGAKEALKVETLEGIADKGYGCDEEILKSLLNGDTPTIYPNKGKDCRTFKFKKTDDEISDEMLSSKDHETLKQCIAAGVLPNVLKRDDVTVQISGRRAPNTSQYMNRETGEIVLHSEMRAAGGNVRNKVEVHRESPLQPYFKRDLETDTVVCPMGQTLFYAGPGAPGGIVDTTIRRYHRLSARKRCPNKCTTGKERFISFKPGVTRIPAHFYDTCNTRQFTQRANHTYAKMSALPENSRYDEWVTVRYYPNQRRLRMRNRIVEHPYGTVKRWNGACFLLTRGMMKASAEMALSFLGYDLALSQSLCKPHRRGKRQTLE